MNYKQSYTNIYIRDRNALYTEHGSDSMSILYGESIRERAHLLYGSLIICVLVIWMIFYVPFMCIYAIREGTAQKNHQAPKKTEYFCCFVHQLPIRRRRQTLWRITKVYRGGTYPRSYRRITLSTPEKGNVGSDILGDRSNTRSIHNCRCGECDDYENQARRFDYIGRIYRRR